MENKVFSYADEHGGRAGIRTLGEFNPTLDFESSALNRTQPPFLLLYPTGFDLARKWEFAQAPIDWRNPSERRTSEKDGLEFTDRNRLDKRVDRPGNRDCSFARLSRTITRQAPSTQRDIIAEALSDWLTKHGHFN